METTSCTFPHSAEKFLHGLATTEKLKVDGLKDDYYNCRGLTTRTSNIDLLQIISNFPLIIALLVYCLLLPVIAVICCSLVFARNSSLKIETSRTRRIRICCYVLLLLIVALMSYCLWLILISTICPLDAIVTRRRLFENKRHAQYINMVDLAFKQNFPPTADYFKLLPENFHNLTNQINHVAIKQLYPNSQLVLTLVEDIRDDLYLLISNLMEFIDSIRFYNRNATHYLSTIFDIGDAFFLIPEMRVSAQQLKQLFCMKQLIENIIEIFKSIVATDHLRESALMSIRKSHERFADFMDDLWEPNAAELNIHRRNMYKALLHLHTLPSEDVLFLPSQVQKSAIVACVIVCLIISLILLLLCGEMILKITRKGKGYTKCLLIIVIVAISLSSLILGYIMALHFSFGVIVNNFLRSMNLPTEKCNDDTDLYCKAFHNIYRLYELNNEEDEVTRRNKSMSDIIKGEIGSFKQSMALWTNPYNQKTQLSTKMNDCVGNFFDANFFTALFEELIIDDLNITLEQLPATDIDASLPIHDLREITLCNLVVTKKRVFGRLLSDHSRKLVLSLSQDAQLLASRLPENLGPLLQQAQVEVTELQLMYVNEFPETSTSLTTLMADMCAEKLETLEEVILSLPDCITIRTSQLGMPPSNYLEMENMEHCFWIGLMILLFIIGPLLIILLVLLHFHDRKVVLIPRNMDSMVPKRRMRPMITLNDSTTVMEVPNYEYDQSNETEQPSTSQPISQPAKRKHELQIKLGDETGVNDA